MARLKTLKLKSKEYSFNAYGNADDKCPAKIIFSRFPQQMETFVPMEMKDVFDGADLEKAKTDELRQMVTKKIIDVFTSNLMANKVDYKWFFKECVDGFRDFEYEHSKIFTVNDFWQILPPEAALTIAADAFSYANEKDEFAMGE